jgi:uncharacterized protein (DUF2164 family)
MDIKIFPKIKILLKIITKAKGKHFYTQALNNSKINLLDFQALHQQKLFCINQKSNPLNKFIPNTL